MNMIKKEPWKTIFRIFLIAGIYGISLYINMEITYSNGTNKYVQYFLYIILLILVIYALYIRKHKRQLKDNDDEFELNEDTDERYEYVTNSFEEDEETGPITKKMIFFAVYFIISILASLITRNLLYIYIFIYTICSVFSFLALSYDEQRKKIKTIKIGIIRGFIYSFTLLPLMALITILILKKYN